MSMSIDIPTEAKHTWAFAKDNSIIKRRQSRTNTHSCVITACSPRAKVFGIKAGMSLTEAKRRAPHMRVLIVGRRGA